MAWSLYLEIEKLIKGTSQDIKMEFRFENWVTPTLTRWMVSRDGMWMLHKEDCVFVGTVGKITNSVARKLNAET
jgi:hypothetical protein